MPVLSVITPWHNTPIALFEECARCVLHQSYTDFEWLIVDDGSDEESARFLDSFARTDPRIRVFHQEKSGVSFARNLALHHMTGAFFTFVDSDDTITRDFFSSALAALRSTNVDIVYGLLREIPSSVTLPHNGQQLVAGEDLRKLVRCMITGWDVPPMYNIGIHRPFAVAPRVYRASSFPDMRFDTGVFVGEDSLFNAITISRASSVLFVQEAWYNYISHDNSTVHTKRSADDILHILSGFDRYSDVALEQGWDASDIGVRFLRGILQPIYLFASYSSVREISSLITSILQLRAARFIKDIDLSQYVVPTRLHALALRVSIASLSRGLSVPLALTARIRHYVKDDTRLRRIIKRR